MKNHFLNCGLLILYIYITFTKKKFSNPPSPPLREFLPLILRQTFLQDCRNLPPLEPENASTSPSCGSPGRVDPSSLRASSSSSESSPGRSRNPRARSRSRAPSSTRSSALTAPSSEMGVGSRHRGHMMKRSAPGGLSVAPRGLSRARKHLSQKVCLHRSSRGHRRPALKSW